MKNGKKKQEEVQPPRPVDIYFNHLDSTFVGSKPLYAILLTLAFFGVMGLVWMIPFPQFDFLKRMNAQTFLNWGSFYIAIIIYLYLKLAPTLSYAALFSIAIMSFFIVQLEYVERDGGPTVILVCGTLALIGLVGIWLIAKKEKAYSGKLFWNLLTIGPIWLWSKVFNKLKIKY
ncbi:hypothetical protein [Sphingobacterium bovistauri]|uniref:DUF962 domain-containing protein n=1 Tax=Sphingobacterium bovistauri TaxID=2781959 RepID=A0ABS7Z3Z2_9SPHI|nr:hypothetical protein [Sphingobacterium bovistauri]MCA5004896.1 hypothetical protein [Sphingobacterium bovistauri]